MNQNAGIRNKLILWALCLCLVLGAAFAVAEPAEPVTEAPVVTADTVTPAVTDAQAAAGFITQVMTGRKLTPPKPRGTVSGDQLTGREALVYAALKPQIQQAAKGQLESTEFQIPVKDIYEDVRYTAADLGVDYIYDSNGWNQAAKDAFAQKTSYDFSLVNRALLYDLPYDLYWFDKTVGVSRTGVAYTSDGTEMWIADYDTAVITYKYCVSSDYAVNHASKGYALDTSYGARAVTAAENARSVVASNTGKSDLHKLQAYKEYICGEVTYNTAAADDKNNTPSGDPWQLVTVFDGDPDPNVVCEGYSKAFQFLCDESRFRNGTSVVSVSGTMAGGTGAGGHMWTIVTMPDGLHYMADITNSDSGSVGQNGGLFLSGYTEPFPENNQYNYTAGGKTIAYVFDANTLQLLSETGMLAMAENDYVPSDLDEDSPTVTEITPLNIPESIQVGEDLPVEVIWPSGWQRAEIHLKRAANAWLNNEYFYYDASNPSNVTTWTASAESMLGSGLQTDTTIYLEFFWFDKEGNESEHLTVNVQVTGALPVMPTAEGPVTAEVGDTILLTGTAGSADSLTLSWYDGDSHDEALSPDADGNWSFQATVNVARVYEFDVRGRTSEGLYTGTSFASVYVDGAASLPAPVFRAPETEEGHYAMDVLPGQAPDGETEVQWYYTVSLRDKGSRSQHYNTGEGADGHLYVETWLTYADEVTVTAMYQLGEEWSRPGSVTFTVPGEPYPVNGPIEYDLDVPATWVAGTDLVIDWEPTVEEMLLNLDISTTDSNGAYTVFISTEWAYDGEPLLIPGYKLEEGRYRLSCWAEAPTYEHTQRVYDLEVTANPNRPAEPVITLSPAEPTDAEEITFIADQVYDALYVDLYQPDAEEGNTPDNPWNVFGTQFGDRAQCGQNVPVGNWTARIRAKLGDVWSYPADISFTVTEAPSVGAIELVGELPAIDMFRPFSITLQPAANATWYSAYLAVGWEGGGGYQSGVLAVSDELEIDEPATEPITLTFTTWPDLYQQRGNYFIYVSAGANGYKASMRKFDNVTVNEVERPAAPTEVQILGSDGTALTEEALQSLQQGVLPVQITYPQPMRQVELVIKQEEENGIWGLFREIGFTLEDAPAAVWNSGREINMDRVGMFHMRARVMVDDIWSPWSDDVSFRIVPPPQLAAPTVTADRETLPLGEALTLTITDIDPNAEWINITYSDALIFDRNFRNLQEPLTVTVPEEVFSAGENTLQIAAAADNHQPGYTEFTITATGQRPDAPDVSIDSLPAPVGSTVYAAVYALDASQVEMDSGFDESQYYSLRNGSVRIPLTVDYYSNRNVSYRFRAQVNGVWSDWTDSIQVTSSTPRPSFEEQQFVVMPEEILPGQDVEITFLPVEGASLYYISMEHDNAPWYYDEYAQPGTVTLPAILFAEGGWFGFDVGCGDQRSPDILIEGRTYEVDPTSEPVGQALTISAAKTDLFYEEEASMSLSVPAEKVMYQIYTDSFTGEPAWADTWVIIPDDGETTLSGFTACFGFRNEGGEYPLRASALVNGAWTDWSNVLTFTEGPQASELLTNPVPQVAPETVEGTPVEITWEAVPNAESYQVTWYGIDNGAGDELTTSDLSLTIPGDQLPMGDYLVYVVSQAPGYGNDYRYIQVPFTVTQALTVGDIVLAEDIPEITMFEPFSVTLQPSEHATRYDVSLHYFTGETDEYGGAVSGTAVEAFLELDAPATAPVTLTLENWNEDARPNDCWLWIEAGADGYVANTKAFYNLTVHEAESLTAPTDIQILGSNGSALTEEERLRMQQGVVPVQITYPQPMQQVKLEIRKEDSSGSENVVLSRTFSMEDPATVWTSGNALAVIYGEGNYSILAQVMVDEVWSPWSEPLRLTMLPPPLLSAPAVEADKEAMILGEPLTLTITEIDPNAEFLFFRVQGEGAQEIHEFERTDLTDPFVITIPANQFFEGTNTITVMAGAESYKGGSAELAIQVTALPAPQVEYSALGGETGDTVYATVTAPGADLVEMSRWPKYYAVQDGTVRIPISLNYYSNTSYRYKFRARVDGIWTAWTEETMLTVSDLPQLTGDIVDLPEEILPGQDVEITFLPVEGITRYDLAISYPSGSYFRQVYEEPGTITLPGILFVNGGSFTFNVRGGDAYAQRLLYENKDYQIAQGTNPGGLEITASKTELAYGETIDVSLNCGAAEQVIIQAYVTLPYGYHVWVCANKIDMQALGLTSSVPLTLNTTGEYPIRAAALVNGEWIGWSNTLTFNLSAPGEQPLENPVPRVDAEIPEGTPAHITWDAVENAETYTVSWRCVKTGATGTDVTSDLFLDIPAEKLSQGDWLVSVTSQAPGYRSGEYLPQVPFTLTERPPVTEITPLNIPESIQVGEDLPVEVIWPDGWKQAEVILWQAGNWLDSRTFNYNPENLTAASTCTFNADYMISSGLNSESEISLEFYWYDAEYNASEHLTVNIQVTGEKPTLPTISESPLAVQPGETIHLAGKAGSADRIILSWNDEEERTVEVPVENGSWSWDGTCPQIDWSLYFEAKGRKENLATGKTDCAVYVYNPDSAPPAPTFELIDESESSTCAYKQIRLVPGQLPESGGSVEWRLLRMSRNTGTQYTQMYSSSRADGSIDESMSSSYEEEVTLTAVYLIDGVVSLPATQTYFLPGQPWPVNGRIPLNLNIPDPWQAGKDLILDWEPVAEGQEVNWYAQDEAGSQLGGTVTVGESIVIPGWFLTEGKGFVRTYTYAETYLPADDWHHFDIIANPSQPAAPTVTVNPAAPTNANRVTFIADREYEEWRVELRQVYGDYMGKPKEIITGSHTDRVTSQSTLLATDWVAKIYVKLGDVWSEAVTVPFSVEEAAFVGDIVLAEDLPEITMFEPFSVTLQPAEHATWYSAVLMYQTGSDDTGTYSSTAVETFLELDAPATTPVTLTLEDWNADAPVGGTYWLWIEAGADGYAPSSRGFYNLTIHEPQTLIPAPIGLSVPTEWPAGKDLTLEWVSLPGVANQDGTLYFDRLGVGDDDWDRWYMSSYLHLKTDTSIILNGYKLEEGEYKVTAVLQADGYETNTVTYPLTITANPDQPAAPVLTLEADPLYVNIPAWITLNREYDEIYCKYLSTEGGFGDDRSSSGDSFRILAEERGDYRVTVSGRIGDVWSPAGRLMVTAQETPAISAIQVLRAPETIQVGDGMILEVLWPDGWDTAFVGIESDGFGSLYANTFHQDIYMPSPYTYVSVQPDSLGKHKVMAGDTLSVELFCLDNKGREMESITLQVKVTGEAVRTMTLPAALTEIEAEAFAGTGAQRIEIPATCTAVGSRAFADSDSLLEVVVRGADTVIPADVFDGCSQKISLWLPSRNSSWEAFRGNPMVAVSFLK